LANRQTEAILVTGGRGFIGRWLVRHLVERDGRVTVISVDKSPTSEASADADHIELEADVRDRTKLREIFEQFAISTVFDLASITDVNLPRSEYLANAEMTKSMVECVSRVDVTKYIFYSSQFVFRKEGTLPANDQDFYPIDDYGESKIRSEQLIRSSLPEDRWLVLRPTYIWGEGNSRFRDGFLYRLAKGQLLVPPSGTLLRYYGYVATICRQTAALAQRPFTELPTRTFYLSDKPINMRTFCEYFVSAFGKGRAWPVPSPVLRSLGRIGDCTEAFGISFPIRGLQADEMTRIYPIPLDPTFTVAPSSTNYQRAAASVVTWALSDPEFSRRIGR